MSAHQPELPSRTPGGDLEASAAASPTHVPAVREPQARSSIEQPSQPWLELRRATPARIALGRVGAGMPTAEVLAFSMAHAQARDAVHLPLDVQALQASLEGAGFGTLLARSQAETRAEYLRRPDLGRRLHGNCVDPLTCQRAPGAPALSLVVGDGLSSRAAAEHTLPMLLALRERFQAVPGEWALDTVVLATQARVALGDEIGALRKAEAAIILIGERPGLSSPSSLSLYLTYAPRPGRSDAERNCISNVRAGGLSYAEAAAKAAYLLAKARSAGASGVCIKDLEDCKGLNALGVLKDLGAAGSGGRAVLEPGRSAGAAGLSPPR